MIEKERIKRIKNMKRKKKSLPSAIMSQIGIRRKAWNW